MSTITPAVEYTPVLYRPALHGVFSAPQGDAYRQVLLVPPLFDERRCAHRVMALCARALASAGAHALVPDIYGTGNSAGALTEIGIERWLDDLRAAIAFLQQKYELPLTIVGCRAGALLAARLQYEQGLADRLLLWQPVLSGRSYLQQARMRRKVQDAMTGGTPPSVGLYEVEGQELSAELYAGIERLALPHEPPQCDTRLVQCSFSDKLLLEFTHLIARWDAARIHTRCLTAEPFWQPHTPDGYAPMIQAIIEEALA